jgi:hypothetical protein
MTSPSRLGTETCLSQMILLEKLNFH